MSRIYFGDWTCAADMDLALRGLREEYEHADNRYLEAPYPLGDKTPAKVLFAASPSTRKSGRPVIVLIRGGMFHVQVRADRWQPKRMDDQQIKRLSFVFIDRQAAAGFAEIKAKSLKLSCDYSQFYEGRCGCGRYIASSFIGGMICTDCAQIARDQFRRDNPIEAARMAAAAEKVRKG